MPNALARSSLFSIEKANTVMPDPVNKSVVHSQGGLVITYTGIPLNQFDLNVWLHLIKITSERQSFAFQITEAELLKRLNITSGGTQSRYVRDVIHKIASGLISINDDFIAAHFINNYGRDPVSKEWSFELNPNTAILFNPGLWSQINWLIRHEVRSSPLALWLHVFCSTHKSPLYPIGLDKLSLLCGSKSSSKEFKRLLLSASKKIEIAAQKYNKTFAANIENDMLYVEHNFLDKSGK